MEVRHPTPRWRRDTPDPQATEGRWSDQRGVAHNPLTDDPAPSIVQRMEFEGRRVVISWLELPYIPPRELTTQSYGICFTATKEIVLVSHDGTYWNLPGGQLYAGESLEEGLFREVMEEACATVTAHEYIGCQRVEDPDHATPEQRFHYQARFWARVELRDWAPKFEIVERRLVSPELFTTALTWGAAPTALRILQLGLEQEARHS